MSNLIFVLFEEQKRQDKVGRRSNELSGNEITEITNPEDKERVAVLECGVTVAKLLDICMGIVEKRRFPYELLIYALLEEIKQTGLQIGNKSHRIEMIIHVARNDVIDDMGIKDGANLS